MGIYDPAAENSAVEAAQDRAIRHGYGYVAISARRYIVVYGLGAGASQSSGQPWRAFANYRTLTRPIDLATAQSIVAELDAAAEASESGLTGALGNAYHRVLTGPHGRTWSA